MIRTTSDRPITVIARNAVTHDEQRREARTGRERDRFTARFTADPTNAVRWERDGVVVGIIWTWEEAQAACKPSTTVAEPAWFATDGQPGTVAEIESGACPWCGEGCDGDPRVIIAHARERHAPPADWERTIDEARSAVS